MNIFLSGAVMAACWTAGLLFFRFWIQTGDRLFQMFAVSFWILGVERMIPVVFGFTDDPKALLYVIRLAAFLLIAFAIIQKNGSSPAARTKDKV